jgi:arylsulfatase A-like enzyme
MMIRYYYAFATLIDDQIGRMVVHMKKKGLLENTMIIFSSDHGQTLGSHGGLVDKGWHHFEETHRIPMIMRFPDARHAGKVIEEFASLADVYPTFLDMAGVDCKGDGIHGRSLMPLVAGDAVDWRDCVVTEFNGLGNSCITQRTLRKGSLKYGYNNTGKCELYDLEKDPDETRNLIGDPAYKDSEVDLAGSLLRWMEQTNDRAVRRFKFSHRELLGIEVSPVI